MSLLNTEANMRTIPPILITVLCLCPLALATGDPNALRLGPGVLVRADFMTPIQVNGWSVPVFLDWDNDGDKDLIVGEGGGAFDGKVRVYTNIAAPGARPRFSIGAWSYVQSNGHDLVVAPYG